MQFSLKFKSCLFVSFLEHDPQEPCPTWLTKIQLIHPEATARSTVLDLELMLERERREAVERRDTKHGHLLMTCFFGGSPKLLESFSNFQGVTLCFFSWGLWVLPTARFIHNAFSIRPLHPHEATISLHWVMPSDDQSESRANCFPYKMVETNEHKRL